MNQTFKDKQGHYHICGFLVISKPRSLMGDYTCLHSLVPKNELPKRLRNKIPPHQIWMRDDIYNDSIKRNITLFEHEQPELERMLKGMKYKSAHEWAEMVDGFW